MQFDLDRKIDSAVVDVQTAIRRPCRSCLDVADPASSGR